MFSHEIEKVSGKWDSNPRSSCHNPDSRNVENLNPLEPIKFRISSHTGCLKAGSFLGMVCVGIKTLGNGLLYVDHLRHLCALEGIHSFSASDDLPGDLNRCAQRGIYQCYFQLQKQLQNLVMGFYQMIYRF